MSIISLFLIVMIVAFAAVFYFTEPSKEDKLINARLVALDQSPRYSEDNENTILRQVTFSRIAAIDKFLRRNGIALYLQNLLVQANVNWTVGRVVFATLLCVGVGALLGNWWIAPGLLGWMSGIVLGAVPVFVLTKMRARRFHRFTELLPQAVDLMSRCLRSGQGLSSAIEVVATELPEPLGTEFRHAADEQSFGLPFRESMLNLIARVPVPDLQFMVTAMLVQKDTGGNLVEILDKTSSLLRDRIRLQGQLRVRTAQGRMTGWILCLLPVVAFFGMNLINPGYGQILFQDPSGQTWVEVAVALMAVGIFLVRRIVDIKV